MSDKTLISYSGMSKFCTCKRAYYWRYGAKIEPLYVSDALTFGKLIHACLEAFYQGKPYGQLIKDNYADRNENPRQAHHFALAFAMMSGYVKKYAEQDLKFNILNTELPFECEIINPMTGRKSRKFRLRGFIDRVNDKSGGIWLHEYKTTAQLNDSYINRIRHNLQELIYVIAYEQLHGVKVKGIIHDAIQKVSLTQGKGETEQEYQTRLAALIAKSKTGKSSAKRKIPETLAEFGGRLTQRYLTDPSVFHREEILVDRRRLEEAKQELWDVTQDIGKCKTFYKSRGQCYGFGECDFFKICNSSDNPLIIKNYYKERQNDVTNSEAEEEHKSF
jgi:hypothetical protein